MSERAEDGRRTSRGQTGTHYPLIVVIVVAAAILLGGFLGVFPDVEKEPTPECTEHSGVLYLDNDTVRNTTDGGVNVTFAVCDETGPFNGSTGES